MGFFDSWGGSMVNFSPTVGFAGDAGLPVLPTPIDLNDPTTWPVEDRGGPVPVTPIPTGGGSSGGEVTAAPPLRDVFGTLGIGLEKLLSNIFGNPAAVAAGNQPTYSPGYYGGQYQYPGQVIPRTTSGVGIGLDGQGIRLSDGSHIGWLPIAAVVFGFYLLQSPGLSRRRNPSIRKRNPRRRRHRARSRR